MCAHAESGVMFYLFIFEMADLDFLFFQDFAVDRYGVSAMVQSQQKLG